MLQISSYQNLLGLLSDTQLLLLHLVNEPDRFEMIKERFVNVSKAFVTLKEYANLCMYKFFPIKLKGDKYFDLLETWFEDFDLGKEAPREEKVIKDSMVKGITQNPYFKILEKDKRFMAIVNKMKENLGGN